MSSEVDRVTTADTVPDKYDHEIRLVDSTVTGGDETPKLTSNGSWRRLARNPSSVKDELSRRKYRSWRQDKYDSEALADPVAEDGSETGRPRIPAVRVHPENEESQTVDFAGRPSTSDEQPKIQKPMSMKKKQQKQQHEVDILYENQRGSFFCGIPLYSHSSLLNFDPAAWVTQNFKDSSVNITNAQVPDPSWTWAWKTWYVDMGGDVDEEGWQYSFSFGRKFAWHGTHPWLYSFVRRRRWLRKRVKRADNLHRDKDGSLEAAHHLNPDYFTIHSKAQDRPVDEALNPEAQLARPVSFTSLTSAEEDATKPDEIDDIPSLMKALRIAPIDREKIEAVKQFVATGGDEIYYLRDKMPEIMSSLVFQNSKMQILQHLKQQAEEAQQHRDEHDADDRPEGVNEKKRIDNLLEAAEAADREIHGLEYWSDRKHVLKTEDENEDPSDQQQQESGGGVGEIRGISEKAETTKEVKVDRRLLDKGKRAERPDPQPEVEGKTQEKEDHPTKDQSQVPVEDDRRSMTDENAWKGQTAEPIEFKIDFL